MRSLKKPFLRSEDASIQCFPEKHTLNFAAAAFPNVSLMFKVQILFFMKIATFMTGGIYTILCYFKLLCTNSRDGVTSSASGS